MFGVQRPRKTGPCFPVVSGTLVSYGRATRNVGNSSMILPQSSASMESVGSSVYNLVARIFPNTAEHKVIMKEIYREAEAEGEENR